MEGRGLIRLVERWEEMIEIWFLHTRLEQDWSWIEMGGVIGSRSGSCLVFSIVE